MSNPPLRQPQTPPPKTKPEKPAELAQVDTIRNRFTWVNVGLVIVSAVDVMAVLWVLIPPGLSPVAMFGRVTGVIVLSVGLIAGIVYLGRYIELQRRWRRPVGCLTWIGFGATLVFEMGVNIGAFSTYKPPGMSSALATIIAWSLGILISMLIYVTGTSGMALERTYDHISQVLKEEERQRRARSKQDRQTGPGVIVREVDDRQPERQPALLGDGSAVDKYAPNPVNVDKNMYIEVDGKRVQVDSRAPEWLALYMAPDGTRLASFQGISEALGGNPTRQHIHKHVNLYRQLLAQQAEA